MTSLFLLIITMFVSCSSYRPSFPNEEIKDGYTLFRLEMERRKVPSRYSNIAMRRFIIKPLESGILAQCMDLYPFGYVITFNSNPHLGLESKGGRMAVLFHELAHCELHLDHVPDKVGNGECSENILEPSIYFTNKCFKENYNKYVDQIFEVYYNKKSINQRIN